MPEFQRMQDILPHSPFALPSSGTFIFPPLSGVSSLPPLPAFCPLDSAGPAAASSSHFGQNHSPPGMFSSGGSRQPRWYASSRWLSQLDRLTVSSPFRIREEHLLGRLRTRGTWTRTRCRLDVGEYRIVWHWVELGTGEERAASDANRASQM